jgi:hypothetical protein
MDAVQSRRERKKEYREKNREKKKEKKKEYMKEYYEKNKEKINEKKKEYMKEYCEKNKEKIKEYYEKNKEKLKEYYEKNKEKINEKNRKKRREYYNKRYQEDPDYKLTQNLRKRARDALKGTDKSKRTMELIGCTIDELKLHLEKQFTTGMSWDTYCYKGWHIDHIIPCASFDLTDPVQQKKCFHYTNLQPLWWDDNISKGAKVA